MFGNPGMLLSPYRIYEIYVYIPLLVPLGIFFSGVVTIWNTLWEKWLVSIPVVGNKTPAVKTLSALTDEYIALRTEMFRRTFTDTTTDYNSGVDEVFYSKKELANVLEEENNALERKWRSKLLFETTPRGNIVMFYDAYKQGFQYFSDQNSIPYALVNAVAMKYVVMFRCRDFFVDEHVLPANVASAMVRAHEAQEKAAKQDANPPDANPESQSKFKASENPAFAKFKSYNTVSTKATGGGMKSSEKRIENAQKEESVAPKRTNSLISMGKMSNFSFLQKPASASRKQCFESDLLPRKQLSYADFKQKKPEEVST